MGGKKGFLRVLLSILAAAFGVQSRGNLEHDFSSGGPWPYVVTGVISTLLFVLALWWLVDQLAASSL